MSNAIKFTRPHSPPTPGHKSALKNAGLDRFFERQFNIETARAYKPAQAVYNMVAQELDVPPSACCMVAAHVWDTIGAQSVGMAGGLLTRPGNAPLPVPGLPQPNADGVDLPALANDDQDVAILNHRAHESCAARWVDEHVQWPISREAVVLLPL